VPLASVSARARARAVFVVFVLNGVAVATWLSRTPAIRDQLDIPISEVGILLAAVSGGSILGLTTSGWFIRRLGARRTLLYGMLAMSVALAATGMSVSLVSSYGLTFTSMALMGFFGANSDVAMNVEGAAAERAAGRTFMPWFHGGWSIGTILAGALGSVMAFADLPVMLHFSIAAVLVAGVAAVTVAWLPDGTGANTHEEQPLTRRERRAIWRDPRTVLIGVIVLGMAFAEGSSNDWLALALVDERGFEHGPAALMFSLFAVAMTAGRFIGAPLIDRVGRVPMLYGAAGLAVVGMLIVMTIPVAWVTVVGVVLWGLGASLGFPVGMSAAADDPRTAAARVSVVSIIGYSAFLVGPPILGFIGDRTSLFTAYILTLVLVAAAALASPAAREPSRQPIPETAA